MEKGIVQRLLIASCAESDANISKLKMTLWLEQSRLIIRMLILFFGKIYPVSSSTARRTEKWYVKRFTFEEQHCTEM